MYSLTALMPTHTLIVVCTLEASGGEEVWGEKLLIRQIYGRVIAFSGRAPCDDSLGDPAAGTIGKLSRSSKEKKGRNVNDISPSLN